MAFAAAVKTSALNWPHTRGTATAFPLAAFGLSAFFFSLIGGILFPGNPSDFLMLLAAGTCGMTFVGFFFLKVYPHPQSQYQSVAGADEDDAESVERPEPLRRTTSKEAKARRDSDLEPGMSTPASSSSTDPAPQVAAQDADETSSLMSTSSTAENILGRSSVDLDRTHRVDLRGFRLLRSLDFWQLFLMMAILAGIGLMTIKYVHLPALNPLIATDS